MKKLVALAVAAAITSPLALAANTPSNVGNVTYLGNIVANSPMWQWTVNDYPGGRLDAKPSKATTANGTTTYPLNGQAFIAVSGYLPSFVGIITGTGVPSSDIGMSDITSLTDSHGKPPADVTDATKGAVTFTIAAQGTDETGQSVEGKLLLKATELRGHREAVSTSVTKYLLIRAGTSHYSAIPGGSCFIGPGSYSSTGSVIGGTAVNPTAGEQSATAFSAFIEALNSADTDGTAGPFADAPSKDPNGEAKYDPYINCGYRSFGTTPVHPTARSVYASAAHVLELTPVELQFSTPLSGAWNSTLTVTAYTM